MKTSGNTPIQGQTLRVLFTKPDNRDGVWVGQCLEYDIAVQARTLPDAHYALQKAIVGRIFYAQMRGIDDPFAGIPRAPDRLWKQYENEGTRLELRFDTFHRDHSEASPLIPVEARVA